MKNDQSKVTEENSEEGESILKKTFQKTSRRDTDPYPEWSCDDDLEVNPNIQQRVWS